MHRGFVKLWRKIKDWEWYKKSETFHLFMHLLLNANHKTSRYQGKEILRGQVVTGRKLLSVETGISEQSIRTSIERLKSTNEITIESTSTFSIITLCNYDTYNDLIECINQEINQETNQRSTSDQPAINQRSTTSKECKNIKNEKNEKKIIQIEVPDHLKEIWVSYVEMRKSIKHPMTDKAQELALKKLKGLSSDLNVQIKIVEQAIMGSYQGLFPLKDCQQQNFFNNKPEHTSQEPHYRRV